MAEDAPEIFMSYSRSDQEFVDHLTRELEGNGFPVWMDREDVPGGVAWREAISRAIRNCHALLVILSPKAIESKNVEKELSLADRHHRQIIPILFESCEIPDRMDYQLAGLQWVDFVARPFEEAFDQLIKALRSHAPLPPRPEREPRGTVVPPSERERRAPFQPSPGLPAPDRGPQQPPQLAPSAGSGMPAPAFPPAATTPPPPAPLIQMLPGVWQIQIAHPLTGMYGQATLELIPSGQFRGQILNPTGVIQVQGSWLISPFNELVLQGVATNGFQVNPYMTVVQFNQVSPTNLTGATRAGEQVAWQRMQ
jgi:TIR domain